MSYLDVPRLHFAGIFIANPSTVNNNPTNFDPTKTTRNPSWNPNGNHFWQFLNCTVQSAFDRQGRVNQDPIIQAAVTSTDTPAAAKLVDLDSEQQQVSQIWGLQLKVAISETDYFVGDFRAVCFNDIFGRVINGGGMSSAGTYFQSVLDNVNWGSDISSPFLQKLQSASPACLSIKFVVDGYQPDNTQANFRHGRVVGTIGPAWADEPPNFVLGRALRPNVTAPNNPLNFGYARVDTIRKKVLVDLGNSIPTTSPGGPPPSSQDFGTLQVVALPRSVSPLNPNPSKPLILGQYDYSLAAYTATAGIQEFSIPAKPANALASARLGIVQVIGKERLTLLQEGRKGMYINATQQVYRMNPGDVEAVELIALQFGAPAAGQQISLAYNNSLFQAPNRPPSLAVGTPESALTFPTSLTTDNDGRASFPITAASPNNPRQYIDGQLYGVGYNLVQDTDPTFPADGNAVVNVLVFDSDQGAPTWENVKPILTQYADLYPFMDAIFQLDDPTVIQQNIDAFRRVLNIPISDPRHMPVTRDMSRDKRQLILDWLDLGAPAPQQAPARPRVAVSQKAGKLVDNKYPQFSKQAN